MQQDIAAVQRPQCHPHGPAAVASLNSTCIDAKHNSGRHKKDTVDSMMCEDSPETPQAKNLSPYVHLAAYVAM